MKKSFKIIFRLLYVIRKMQEKVYIFLKLINLSNIDII